MICTPGRPNTHATPSRCRAWTIACPPVICAIGPPLLYTVEDWENRRMEELPSLQVSSLPSAHRHRPLLLQVCDIGTVCRETLQHRRVMARQPEIRPRGEPPDGVEGAEHLG